MPRLCKKAFYLDVSPRQSQTVQCSACEVQFSACIAGCDQTAGQSPRHWFNQSCYPLPPGIVGNLGKNTVTAPGYEAVDFSLSKDTRLLERLNVQFRAEIFNIFNHC